MGGDVDGILTGSLLGTSHDDLMDSFDEKTVVGRWMRKGSERRVGEEYL